MGHPPVIDIIHGGQHPDGQAVGRRGQLHHLTTIMEAANLAYHGRRSAAKHLHQAAGGQGRHHLGHRDLPLRDGDAGPRGHHLDDGAPRDPRQDDAAGQRRGDQLEAAGLCPQEGEEVHGAHLCDLVVLAVEPEALVAALALRNLQASIKYGRMGQSKKLLCKFLYRIVLIIFVVYTGTVYHDWLVWIRILNTAPAFLMYRSLDVLPVL